VKIDIGELIEILDLFKQNAVEGTVSIKHAMNIYNAYVKNSIRILGEGSFEEYVYSFDDLCYMFKDFNAMLEYIKDKITSFLGLKTNMLTEDVRNEYFRKVINYINQNFYKDITIRSLSQDFIINPNYISQLFRKEVGMTFTDYITKLRVNYAKELLQNTEYSQGEIATKCGYTDYFYFIRVFKKTTGVTPGQFRHKEE
jgi:two-component system response regulator YesN